MLRITERSDAGRTALALEGRLAGPWVDELARSWDTLVARQGGPVAVCLEGVTFIDAGGKALLRRLHEQGATFVASGCMTRAILDDIARDKR